MKIGFMRLLDIRVGGFFCGVVKLWDRTFGLLTRKKKFSRERILIIKISEMGAVVLAMPLMQRLREKYPQEDIFWLIFHKNTPIVKALDLVPEKNIITVRDDSLFIFIADSVRAVLRLRKEGISATLDLEFFARCSALLAYLTGAKKRIGFYHYAFEGLFRGDLLTHNVQYNPLLHTAKMYYAFADMIDTESKRTPEIALFDDRDFHIPRMPVSAPVREKVMARLKEKIDLPEGARIFLVNPGEGMLPLREWPFDNFVALCRKILEEKNSRIVVVGSTGEGKGERLAALLPAGRSASFAGETDIFELVALLDIGDCLIVNDCGMAHIASLAKIKQFVFFGPETPALFGPLSDNATIFYARSFCSPCFSAFNHRESACENNICLQHFRVEDVYRAIQEKIR